MTTWQILLAGVGTLFIRLLHVARRRLAGPNRYFSFSDFLEESVYVHTGGFLLAAMPPFVGGLLISFLPDVQAPVAGAAGFLAAFLGVWPVLQHPYQLLDKSMQRQWPKLRLLYFIFMGSSAALAYVGFELGRALVPLSIALIGTAAWRKFVEDVAANALYDAVKWAFLALLSLGGFLAYRQRKRIGEAALRRQLEEPERADDWQSDAQTLDRRHADEGYEETP